MRVFYTDFNSGAPSQFQGIATTVGVEGFNGIGTGNNRFGGSLLRNATGGDVGGGGSVGAPQIRTVLTLSGLPEHNSIDLNFLFAKIDSWDGNNVPNTDYFNVVVDGRTIFRETFTDWNDNQSYNPPPRVFLGRNHFGFSNPNNFSGSVYALDSAYNLGLDPTFDNIPHTSSSLTIEWFADGSGWQGGWDESWAIDNVEVIVNDDSFPVQPTLSLGNNITIREGNRGQTNLNIPITLSRPSSEAIRVNVSTANGTATGGSDFTPLNQTITFNPNSTRANVTVAVRGDTTVERDETFFVNLGNPVGATIDRGRTQVTIDNDDRSTPPPSPTISIQNASIREGNSGTRNMVFNVRLSGRSSETITADYITGNGSARAPLDYNARSGQISFAPGRTTGTISIGVRGDTLFESNETFTLSLSNLSNVRAGDTRATGTILNDDTRSRNIDSLSLGKSDNIIESNKVSDYADVFAVDTGV